MIQVDGEKLSQWDLGRTVRINCEKTFSEVHFYRTGDSEALVVTPKEDDGGFYAEIPNILLQTTKVIYCLLVAQSGNTESVVEQGFFNVNARAKPADYIYTEVEILSYEGLEKRIAALEYYGPQNAGKLLFVGYDGSVSVLRLGSGLSIQNGMLCCLGGDGGGSENIATAILGAATLGQLRLGG